MKKKIIPILTAALAFFTAGASFAGDYSTVKKQGSLSKYTTTIQTIDWRDYVDQNYQTYGGMKIIVEERGPKWRAVYEDEEGNKHRIPGENGNLVATETEAENNADDQREQDESSESDGDSGDSGDSDGGSESDNSFYPERPVYRIPVEEMTDEQLDALADEAVEAFLTGR